MSASYLTAAAARSAEAGSAAAAPHAPSPLQQLCFTETFAQTDHVHFQLTRLGAATYLWIGSDEGCQQSLAMGVPSTVRTGPPAAGTTLLGGGTADGASQTMAQRLARKLGQPVFVSMNLKDDAALRMFAERHALAALQRVGGTSAASAAAATPPPAPPPPGAPPLPAQKSGGGGGGGASAAAAAGSADDAAAGARVFEVFESPSALGERGAALVLAAARDAIAARGRFSIALSGGSIPTLLSPALLAAGGAARFERWLVFLADERYVPAEHPDSNLGAWRTSLLEKAGIPAGSVFGLNAGVPLEQACLEYEAALLQAVGGGPAGGGGAPPAIDALLLGMGPDGHTASLFPGHPLVGEAGRWVAPIADSPKPPPCRITLTLPALNAARLAVFVVTGGSKAECVRRAFMPEPDVPSGLVLATERTHWLLDPPAASQLLEEQAKQDHLYG